MVPQPVHLLLIEDDRNDAELIRAELEAADASSLSYSLVHTRDLATGLERLQAAAFDAVLTDLNLPDSHGLETLLQLKARAPGVPVLLLTGLRDEALALEAVREGAQDYLVKDRLERNRLIRAIHYAIERKRAETELRRERDRAQLYLEIVASIIIALNPEGAITLINQRGCQVIGYTEQELLGRNWYDLCVSPSVRAAAKRDFHGFIAGEVALLEHYELPVLTKHGEERRIIFHHRLIWDEAGNVSGALASGEDVTERLRVERAMRASEERYRIFVHNSTEGIWRFELEQPLAPELSPADQLDHLLRYGYVAECNDAMARMHGWMWAEDITGARLGDLFANTDPHSNYLPLFIQSGYRLNEAELHTHEADGRKHYFTASLFGLMENGHLVRAWGIQRDITERKRVEEALHHLNAELEARVADRTAALSQSNAELSKLNAMLKAEITERQRAEERTRSFIKAIPDLIFEISPDGLLMGWHAPTREDLAHLPGLFPGRPIRNVFPPALADRLIAVMESAALARDLQVVEFEWTSSEGPVGEYEARIVPTASGEVLWIVRNISERKRAEAALRSANAELARAVRLKDEFLANMSHELRTPLNAILGLSEALNEEVHGPLTPKQKQYVQTITQSGQHLLELINDILDLSKIEAGRMELQLEPIAIDTVCQASVVIVRELAQKKRLRLSYEHAQAGASILADTRRLKQMLVNLLSNAVKFTDEGGEIGLAVDSTSTPHAIHFTVWDTGIGIPADGLQRLFRPFVQLDSGLARQYQGTGLGLALVARMAKLHGGSVSVQSEPGRGSRFTISLPRGEVGLPSEVDLIRPASDRPAPVILLVDDNETVILTVYEHLLMSGYQAIIAKGWQEGVERAKTARPDLILLDMQMSDIDGLEAARRLRTEPALSGTPIIALSALLLPGDRERCLAAGFNDYLPKPLSLEHLIQMVNAQLQPASLGERV